MPSRVINGLILLYVREDLYDAVFDTIKSIYDTAWRVDKITFHPRHQNQWLHKIGEAWFRRITWPFPSFEEGEGAEMGSWAGIPVYRGTRSGLWVSERVEHEQEMHRMRPEPRASQSLRF